MDSMKNLESVELLIEGAREIGMKDGTQVSGLGELHGGTIHRAKEFSQIKVRAEDSDKFHFRHIEFQVPMEHLELRKEVCTRDTVLTITSYSIISMETCRV